MTKQDILNYLSSHKKEFLDKYGINKVALFGSVARGEDKEISYYKAIIL